MSAAADQTPEEIMREHPEAEPSPIAEEAKSFTKKGARKAETKAYKANEAAGAAETAEDPAKPDLKGKVSKKDVVIKPSAKKLTGKASVESSEVVFKGRVFDVTSDRVTEPGGVTATREVVRHHGSVVILAVDAAKSKRNPNILLIRQYRHAAGKFLLELPAGRIEAGEKLIPAAKRELVEETGFTAKKWSRHITYFASPGFLSEAMNILLAEDLKAGIAQPEEDERIELHMTPLKDVLKLIHEGRIEDGKTLIGVLSYASLIR